MASRRLGYSPARRFALAAGLIVVALLTGAGRAAGQTVIEATVFGEGPGSTGSRPVTTQTLAPCSIYQGSSPITLYPGQQPFAVPTTSSWAVSEVLTCALDLPAADLSSVQIFHPQHGYENPLTVADLTDTSRYHDPAAVEALPVISTDGGQDLNTFTRPWRGGTDANGRDQVTESQAPVSIVVFTKGAPLAVHPAQRMVRKDTKTFTAQLSATVTDAGSLVPPAALRWSWNFADGSTSPKATPTPTFTNGVYPVTVLVTDTQTGRGGTATLLVSAPAHAPQGNRARSGGQRASKSSSPTGSTRSHSTRPGSSTRTGAAPASSGQPAPARTSSPSATPTSPASTTPAAPATPARIPATAARPRTRSRPIARRVHHRTSAGGSGVKLVTGRLIADVTPLPAGATPVTPNSSAPSRATPVVREASTAPASLSAVLAALAVLALLALGAAHEGRGLRARRAPRGDG